MSATNRGAKRVKNDKYATPSWMTAPALALLREYFTSIGKWDQGITVLEPACGDLAIVDLLVKWLPPGSTLQYSDIEPPSTDIGQADFLTSPPLPIFDLIITNPPYSLAQEFCEHAKKWCKDGQSVVAMLLRINFLGSRKRAKWMRSNTPTIWVSPRRPSFGLNKEGKKGTDATEYAWFIWDGQKPTIVIMETE